ncbi:hypothetical protein [Aquimarina algiphila]|uniref:hypothetical protein n=1 Tax=Aquimarina algiphila TaxID=2047982 RepID=UPI00232EEC4F|nr:hypothetical protein [Aquimarina algiphila]
MKNVFTIAIFSILCISCTQESILQETNNEIEKTTEFIDTITHEYDYYGKIFKITYFLDTKESKVVNIEGDVEIGEEVFGKRSDSQSVVFKMNGENNTSHLIRSKVFNTYEEVTKYLGHDSLNISEAKNQKNECNDVDTYGPIDYRFYEDIDYFNEMNGITGFKRKKYSKHQLGIYNDRLSSFRCSSLYQWEVSLTLFEDICRGGNSYTFFKAHNAPNLRVDDLRPYTLSGWWFWRQSWNDNVSSFSATSKKP